MNNKFQLENELRYLISMFASILNVPVYMTTVTEQAIRLIKRNFIRSTMYERVRGRNFKHVGLKNIKTCFYYYLVYF